MGRFSSAFLVIHRGWSLPRATNPHWYSAGGRPGSFMVGGPIVGQVGALLFGRKTVGSKFVRSHWGPSCAMLSTLRDQSHPAEAMRQVLPFILCGGRGDQALAPVTRGLSQAVPSAYRPGDAIPTNLPQALRTAVRGALRPRQSSPPLFSLPSNSRRSVRRATCLSQSAGTPRPQHVLPH